MVLTWSNYQIMDVFEKLRWDTNGRIEVGSMPYFPVPFWTSDEEAYRFSDLFLCVSLSYHAFSMILFMSRLSFPRSLPPNPPPPSLFLFSWSHSRSLPPFLHLFIPFSYPTLPPPFFLSVYLSEPLVFLLPLSSPLFFLPCMKFTSIDRCLEDINEKPFMSL